MMDWMKPLGLALALTAGAMAHAQETAEGETPDPLALSTGEPVEDGGVFVAETHGDWEIRCIRTDEIANPCQMYQLLFDQQGNSVAEINVFYVGDEGVPAGATIVTPLETLLTQNLTLQVDDGTPRRYPFSWCSQLGCVVRVGMTAEELEEFKAGGETFISIVPVAAPDQRVSLVMSLVGFTAGYEALISREPELSEN